MNRYKAENDGHYLLSFRKHHTRWTYLLQHGLGQHATNASNDPAYHTGGKVNFRQRLVQWLRTHLIQWTFKHVGSSCCEPIPI